MGDSNPNAAPVRFDWLEYGGGGRLGGDFELLSGPTGEPMAFLDRSSDGSMVPWHAVQRAHPAPVEPAVAAEPPMPPSQRHHVQIEASDPERPDHPRAVMYRYRCTCQPSGKEGAWRPTHDRALDDAQVHMESLPQRR